MEVLGAAGSIVNLATVLAQLINSIKQLHHVWLTVKDFPISLLWLSTDLVVLQQILTDIDAYSIGGF